MEFNLANVIFFGHGTILLGNGLYMLLFTERALEHSMMNNTPKSVISTLG